MSIYGEDGLSKQAKEISQKPFNKALAASLSVDFRKRYWRWKRTWGSRYRTRLVFDRIAASFSKPNPLFQYIQGKSPIQSVIDEGVYISECIQYTELSG